MAAQDRCTGLQETARRLEQDVFPGLPTPANTMQSQERRAQNLKDQGQDEDWIVKDVKC